MKVLDFTRHKPAAWVLTAVLFILPGPAHGQTHPSLTKARQEFINQNHATVIKLVKPLVEPKSVLSSEAEEAEAYELLGISYWWLKKYKVSEAAFLVLLSIRPRHQVKKSVHGEAVWKFFRKVKKKFEERPTQLRKKQLKELKRCRRTLKSARGTLKGLRKRCLFRIVQKKKYRPRWLGLIPFGVGQFAQGRHTRGWIFFSIETAFALMNITAHVMAQTDFAYRRNSVGQKVVDVKRAQALQIVEIASGITFLVAAGVGIIEALVNYQPVKTVELKVPIETAPSRPKPTASRFRIMPAVGKNAGMLTLSLDF